MDNSLGEGQKTIAKGTFWSISGTVALKLVSLVYTILLARLFTPEDVGLYYLSLSVIYIVSVFADLGLTSAFTRYVPYYIGKGEKEKAYKLLTVSYLFSGTLSFILAAAIFLFAAQISGGLSNPLLVAPLQVMAIFLVLSNFFGLNTAFLGGLKKIKESNVLLNGQNLLKLVLTLGLYFWIGASALVITSAFVASYFVFVFVSFWYAEKEAKKAGIPKLKLGLGEQIELLKETVPFGITIALIVGIANFAFYMDRIIMSYLMPPEISAAQIGIYSIAISMALLIPIFPGSILSIFSPMAAELHGKGDTKEMEKLARTAVRWNVFLLVPFSILMIVFASEILQMFYGSAYAAGGIVLAIFALGTFFRLLTNIEGAILASMRIIKVEFIAAAIALVLNLVLCWFLIPIYGMAGAAAASAFSLLVTSIMIAYYCKKIAGFEFSRELLKPIGAGILTLAVILLIRENAIALINAIPPLNFVGEGIVALVAQKMVKLIGMGILFALICLVYGAFAILLKAIKKEDWELLFAAMRRGGVPTGWVKTFGEFTMRFF